MKTALAILGLLIIGAIAYYVFVIAPAATLNTNNLPSIGTPAPGNERNYPEPEGKLNINVICEGALAYMSFPNGTEAEAWVEACKRGEHPEAIEQWKQQNGIIDDRAI